MIGRKIIIGLIRMYQGSLGLYLGGNCRFYPSCSEYAVSAVQHYGATRGTWLALKRFLRCRPLGPCGADEVPHSPLT